MKTYEELLKEAAEKAQKAIELAASDEEEERAQAETLLEEAEGLRKQAEI